MALIDLQLPMNCVRTNIAIKFDVADLVKLRPEQIEAIVNGIERVVIAKCDADARAAIEGK